MTLGKFTHLVLGLLVSKTEITVPTRFLVLLRGLNEIMCENTEPTKLGARYLSSSRKGTLCFVHGCNPSPQHSAYPESALNACSLKANEFMILARQKVTVNYEATFHKI